MTRSTLSSIFKMKLIVFFALLTFVDSQMYEGDDCAVTKNASPGICTLLSKCKSAQDDLKNKRIQPQMCGFSGSATLVCCPTSTSPALATPSSLTSSPPVSNTECVFPPEAVKVKRNEWPQKAWNKCIDLADSVYPCVSPGFSLNAAKIRLENCAHTAAELIIGGTETKPKEFPHMAALGYENPKTQVINWDCGGTLISEQWVMTAAHCVFHRALMVNVTSIILGGGDLDVAESKYIFTVIRREKHPNYQADKVYNDIALLMLDRIVKYSKSIRPACLHVGNPIKSEKAIAIGYGNTEDNQKSNKLLKVVLNKYTYEECSEKNPAGRKSPDGLKNTTQICYGNIDEVKDTCQGDSGGPLQIYNTGVHCTYNVIGITSVGKLCGVVGSPAIYTRVSAFLPWIESIVWTN